MLGKIKGAACWVGRKVKGAVCGTAGKVGKYVAGGLAVIGITSKASATPVEPTVVTLAPETLVNWSDSITGFFNAYWTPMAIFIGFGLAGSIIWAIYYKMKKAR